MNLRVRIKESSKKTAKVLVWVGGSAAISAVCTHILNEPDFVKYYGIINIILFFLNELRKNEFIVDNE